MLKLRESIYHVGAINPNMRIFDIIMKTEYGTTYNSYLVTGEKNVLIETVHDRFAETLFQNIENIIPEKQIDYIIMNHSEPDHSGSIAKLIEINPDITIVGTAAAIKNISNITNLEFNSKIVKTGNKLDIGNGMELEFIVSPNLHWPDSMFTYIPSRKTVFTCDFLGAHYCEPLIWDEKITYPEAYSSAFKYYYDAIFGPFKKFVIDGLDRLAPLDFDMVCTSHGPVLTSTIKEAMTKYREWSAPKNNEKSVSIFYVSAYGYTKAFAEETQNALKEFGIKAEAYDIIHTSQAVLSDALESSSGYMFGSPTINRDALKPVWDLISCIDAVNAKGKPVQVFGSYGWSGEACKAIQERIVTLGLKPVSDYYQFLFKPDSNDLIKAKELAKAFAEKI